MMYDVYKNVQLLCKQCVAESTAGLREDPNDRDPAEDPVHRQGDDAGRSRSVAVSLCLPLRLSLSTVAYLIASR